MRAHRLPKQQLQTKDSFRMLNTENLKGIYLGF